MRTDGMNIVLWCVTLSLLLNVTVQLSVRAEENPVEKGRYYLVGTGPGDGNLLTARARDVLQNADIIFCDEQTRKKLAPYVDFEGKEVVDGYGRLFPFYGQDCAELSEEEKQSQSGWNMTCEDYHRKQAEFVALVKDAVAQGKTVALTTGGNPTIYGPSVWSVDALRDIDPVVIPGLSSFNAANAALQISLGEVILTAPLDKKGDTDTIESLAVHDGATMVVFMARDLDNVLRRLAGSYPADTPIALVSYAGYADRESVITGTVGNIREKIGDREPRLFLIYVGKDVGNAQYANPEKKPDSKGKFYLVGMGPGDADLATLRTLKVIEESDLIFCEGRLKEKFSEYLKGKEVVEGHHRLFPFYGEECSELTDERKSRERMSCEDYHRKQAEFAAMVRKAVSEGKKVAMLDSGDPLVYGPCAWSLTELRDLDTEVVPGLSAFNAANAAVAAGITEGKTTHSVIFASGWSVEEMAAHKAAMVLFTMRTDFEKFITALSRHYPPETPVAVIVQAGYKEKEKVVRATLGTIIDVVGKEKLPFEYMLYVGDFLENR